jgi:hypothetical protein
MPKCSCIPDMLARGEWDDGRGMLGRPAWYTPDCDVMLCVLPIHVRYAVCLVHVAVKPQLSIRCTVLVIARHMTTDTDHPAEAELAGVHTP